jgi:hypothetical protein
MGRYRRMRQRRWIIPGLERRRWRRGRLSAEGFELREQLLKPLVMFQQHRHRDHFERPWS